MRKLWMGWLLAAATVTMVNGCVVEVTIDSPGTELTFGAAWTVNGATPTAASCAAAGIANVEMVFFDAGGPSFFPLFFYLPCADGLIDTRLTNDRVLDTNRDYVFEWRAYDDLGVEISTLRSSQFTFSTTSALVGQHISLLDAYDFRTVPPSPGTDLSVDGAWLINGMTPDAANCASANIAEVEVIFSVGGTAMPFPDLFRFPCDQGSFATAPNLVLALAMYSTEWRAYDSGGLAVATSAPLVLDTTAQTTGGNVTLATTDFITLNSLDIDVLWQRSRTDTIGADCVTAGVLTMTFELNDAATSMPVPGIPRSMDVACGSPINFPDLAVGTYDLVFLDATSTTGAKNWMGTCAGFVVAPGRNLGSCVVSYVGP